KERETGEIKDRKRSGRPQILSPNDVKEVLDIKKTADDWRKVIFSDESKFVLFGSNFRKFC
ncbi:16897_t:CDS:2, partial [Dentiscutata erythropus]